MSAYTDVTEDYSGLDDLSSDRNNRLPLSRQDHLPFYRIFGICSSLIVFQIAYSIEFSIITPMMTNFHIPTVIKCIEWMLISILSLFMHPLITYFSNLTNTRFGKRRPFILAGGIILLISFISLFCISGYLYARDEQSKSINSLVITIFLVTFLILHLSIKMVQVPSQFLFSEIIPHNDQKYAKSMGSIISSFASIFTFIIGGFDFSQYLPKSTNNNYNILTSDQFLLTICFFIILVCLISTLIASKEDVTSESILKPVINPFKEIQQVLSSRPKPVIWICVIYIFSWMAYYPFIVFVTNYFGHTIKSSKITSNTYSTAILISNEGKSFGMLVLALSQIIELMISFVVPKIISKINMKRTYIISMSILTVMLIFSGPIKNKYALMGIYSLLGICPAIFKTIPHLLIQIIVPSEQLNVHRNILNSAASIGKMASMLLLGICVEFINPNDRLKIAGGALFSLISSILCHWMILPFNPIEFEQELIHSSQK